METILGASMYMLDKNPGYEPKKIDLLSVVKAPKMRSVLVENISHKFLRDVAFELLQKTRHNVRLKSHTEPQIISHEEAFGMLPKSYLAGICDMSPLRGRMLVAIDSHLVGAIVDIMCGASEPYVSQNEEMSVMEVRLGKQVVNIATEMMSKSLKDTMDIDIHATSYETRSGNGMLAIADAQDWMITVTGEYETDIGEGSITVIIPYTSFEAVENKYGMIGMGSGDDEEWRFKNEALSGVIPVEVRAEIVRAFLPMTMIRSLKAGTVIPVRLLPKAIISIGDQDIMLADYGSYDGRKACIVYPEIMNSGESTLENNEQNVSSNAKIELDQLVSKPSATKVLGGKQTALDKIQVTVSVELGRATLTVKDIRDLRHGQVIGLDSEVGEPVFLYVNGEKYATCEVIDRGNNQYGVRVVGIIDSVESNEE